MRIHKTIKNIPRGTDARKLTFAVAVSQFNAPVTESLLNGCLSTFKSHGVPEANIRIEKVPGAFELPLVCQRLARLKKYHAVIALGCIIRGQTPHDRYIAQAVAHGLQQAALSTGAPVLFGVLTTLNEKQAWARAGAGPRNKGREAALAALEMANIL